MKKERTNDLVLKLDNEEFRKNLLINNHKIVIEKLSEEHIGDAIKLATEVFKYEQNIPEELIPVRKELNPVWWGAKLGDIIVGVTAAWTEDNQVHWGRFAVNKKMRGLGIGKEIIELSFKEIFENNAKKIINAKEIIIEARDVTVKLLKEYGGKIVGERIVFYGEPVTPIMVTREGFLNIEKI